MAVIVGNYLVEHEIGRGGMGVVYAASHRVLGRKAAIKLLLADAVRPDQVERFYNEARAAMAIDHAGVVEIYDVGLTAEGTAYIAMELLAGEPLAAVVDRGPLPVRVAVDIAHQIACALDAAHRAGVIHRDLKPANVFVGANGRIKLLDFGIAKLSTAPGSTLSGAVLGTPRYMSPEQCASARDVDARSDLYSLGCVLFAMLAGAPPFDGETGQLIGMHQFVAAPPLRDRCPLASPALEAAVAMLLAKSPTDRFQTARAVGAALGAPDVVALGPSAGGDPTADLPAGQPLPRPSTAPVPRVHAPAPAPERVDPSTDAPTAAAPSRRRRAAIVATLLVAAIAGGLAIWRCTARPAPAVGPVVAAAVDASSVAASASIDAPIDAPIAVVSLDAPLDAAAIAATGNPDAARRAPRTDAAVGRITTGGRADAAPVALITSSPDASPVAAAPDPDDIALRTFESGQTRLEFKASHRVVQTTSGSTATGSFGLTPRHRRLRIEWDPSVAGHTGAYERYLYDGECTLKRFERIEEDGTTDNSAVTFHQVAPPCP